MSEIDDAAAFAPPAGVAWVIWPGWDFIEGEGYGDQLYGDTEWPATVHLVETKAGKIADHFHSNIWLEDEAQIALYFEVSDAGSVQLAGVMARDDTDFEEAFRRLTEVRPLSWWRTVSVRYALMHSLTYGVKRKVLMEQLTNAPDGLRRQVGPIDLTQAPLIATAPGRGRITQALLQEVARVYREAFAAGQPPTEAVAAHFDKPRSTAGRWVSQARRTGALGPADGPRAGEAVNE